MGDQLSAAVEDAIECRKQSLHDLSQFIWRNPELALQEVKAHDYLTEFLESEDFSVQRNYLLPTAFRAEYQGKAYGKTENGGPTVALLCEYDALPDIGHACGHNLIAESAVAAGIAVKEALRKDTTLPGKVVVLGTPGEENCGGKEMLIQKGALSDVHAAMMAHPGVRSGLKFAFQATLQLTVRFFGRTAHAAASPWDGVNALDAAVISYLNISLLRQQLNPAWKVCGIVIRAGRYANVIPEESELQYHIRAPNLSDLDILLSKVQACFQSAAGATGCTMEIKKGMVYKNMINNISLACTYQRHAERLGICFQDPDPDTVLSTGASTDAGNVSHVIPCIHPSYQLHSVGRNHTRDFQAAVGQEEAQPVTRLVAKALALTAIEFMRDTALQERVRGEFNEAMSALHRAD